MIKRLQIINIDGTEGAGKTTQVNLLLGTLKQKGFETQANFLDDTIKSANECAKKTREFLEKNPDGIVINDGSIARMIVTDLNNGISHAEVAEKYLKTLEDHEYLNHRYGMANILLILDDLNECDRRLINKRKLLGKEEVGIENQTNERYILNGLRKFDANTISRGLKFDVIEISSSDSMLEIRDIILEYLEDNFDIKKPSN